MNLDLERSISTAYAVIYCFRHQESLMNANGFGERNSPLSESGRKSVNGLAKLVEKIGVNNIATILTGTLSRQQDTTMILAKESKYSGPILSGIKELDAFDGKDLFSNPPDMTYERYSLNWFANKANGLFSGKVNGIEYHFDSVLEQVCPYSIYCSANINKVLRQLVFPNSPLPNFNEIEKNARFLHAMLKNTILEMTKTHKQPRILIVGSCSSLAMMYELGVYGTVGENAIRIINGNPTHENIANYRNITRLYPQSHSQVGIMHMSYANLFSGREIFKLFQDRLLNIGEII